VTLQDSSVRGRIQAPNLDDRVWSDLVAEAVALIPTYAPQWNDLNPSDLGITVVELFAWLVEGLIYRLNKVPEQNYVAFLNLLGITLDPPTPARAYLSFTALPATVVVPQGKQAQTQGTETDAPIVFETDETVTVLPVNLTTVLELGKTFYTNASALFAAPPNGGDTLTIPNGQSMTLCLGFDQATTAEVRLILTLFNPVRIDQPGGAEASVTWTYSTAGTAPASWPALPSVTDNTAGLQQDGDVRFTPPAGWASQAPSTSWPVPPHTPADAVTTPLFWVGLRIANLVASPIGVGIGRLLFNAASATNALTIPLPEPLGTSDGTPFQVFALKYQPLYERPNTDTPYDHLVVQVAGVSWSAVDDFPAGPGNYYRVNPVAGEVRFGNYNPATTTGNGTVPPTNANVVALSYRYVVGGASGNVGPGALVALRTPVAGITAVTNYAAAFDGADEEAIEDAKRLAPEALKTRDRAVTAEDYENLARAVSTDVKKTRCLVPQVQQTNNLPYWSAGDPWTFGGLLRAAGNVNVIVVSDLGHQEPRPVPPAELVRQVQQELDKKRDVTAQLRVTGPRYLPVLVNVAAFVWQKAINAGLISGAPALHDSILSAINAFLHPLTGNLDGNGWEVGASVFIADLFKAIMPPENLGFISALTLAADTPPYFGPGPVAGQRPFPLATPGVWVQLADYELVCSSTNHTVTVNVK